MLFFMTISSICRKGCIGKLARMWNAFNSRKSCNALMPMSVSMLVYIDLASAENRTALFGNVSCFRSCIISVEFLVYEQTKVTAPSSYS